MSRYWLVHYVNRDDPGDLLWGYNWKEAIWVDEDPSDPYSFDKHEENMFDRETGKNVGNTRNYCLNPRCGHEDCGPAVIIFETEETLP